MTVLAFDPGPALSGWCLIRGIRVAVEYLAGGRVQSEPAAFREVVEAHAPDLVAVEEVHGYAHEHVRSAALVATATVAGGIIWAAAERGITVARLPASVWRKRLCGKATASDATIAAHVKRVTYGLPKRTNAHVRDALGLAIVAYWTSQLTPAGRALANGEQHG